LRGARRRVTSPPSSPHHENPRRPIGLRISVNDAMDVHGGKAIMKGRRIILAACIARCQSASRSKAANNCHAQPDVNSGQGAIRSHPYILKEMLALEDDDHCTRSLKPSIAPFWAHVGHAIANTFRAWVPQLDRWQAVCARALPAGKTTHFYRQISRYALRPSIIGRHDHC